MRVRNLLIICLLSILPFVVQAKSAVWKITDGNNFLFLGGTIHLLSKQDYPLPAEFELAYQKADSLVFEVEPDVVNSKATQEKFAQYAYYTDGTTLKQALNPATYKLLNDFFAVRNLPIAAFESMKPGMLSVVLTVLELQRLGLAGQGVDEFFNEKSKKDNKPRHALETVDDQFRALSVLGVGQENYAIRHAIDEAEKISQLMQDIKSAWRIGDNEALITISLEPWVERFPELYQSLLVQRNNRWLPKLDALLKTPDVEYVLVGALHLVGKDGLLALFRQKGYNVEQVISP